MSGVIELVSFQENRHNIMSRSTIIFEVFCLDGWIFSGKLQKEITENKNTEKMHKKS